MKTFWFVVNLLFLAFIALALLLGSAGVFAWLIVLVLFVRTVLNYVAWRHLQKRIKEYGYQTNPFTTFKKLKKEFESTNYTEVRAVLFDTNAALHERPEWTEAAAHYDSLNPMTSNGSSLGTDNAIINIIGGYFMSAMKKRAEAKAVVLCFALQNGRYRFVHFYGNGGNQKKMDELLSTLASLGIHVDRDPVELVRLHRSFRLS